ncbi:MAG: hypothetical protein GY725_27120 [bacterium]|nr:hypothetical protein [bacterium]
MLRHALELRRPGRYVGQFALLLYAVMTKRRLHLWEGNTRIDLVKTYAPVYDDGSLEDVLGDIVACVRKGDAAGFVHQYPVSEVHPLDQVNHFLALFREDAPGSASLSRAAASAFAETGPGSAAAEASGELSETGAGFSAAEPAAELSALPVDLFYKRLGCITVGTVCDGDCAIDALCTVGGHADRPEVRQALRERLAGALVDRVAEKSLQHAFIACAEFLPQDGGEAEGASA